MQQAYAMACCYRLQKHLTNVVLITVSNVKFHMQELDQEAMFGPADPDSPVKLTQSTTLQL